MTDFYEIASEPVPENGTVLTMFARRADDGEVHMQLASMRVTKEGLKRPPSPMPLVPANLDTAIRLVEEGEARVASGEPIVFPRGEYLVELARDGEMIVVGYGNHKAEIDRRGCPRRPSDSALRRAAVVASPREARAGNRPRPYRGALGERP